MKIYRRPRTWVMFGILIIIILLMSILLHVYELDNWGWVSPLQQYAEAQGLIYYENTFWSNAYQVAGLMSLVSIFTIVIAGDIVAAEFSWGTIKLLLIRPFHRSKVLLSKFIACIIFALFMLTTLFILSILINGILKGFDGFSASFLYMADNGEVVERSMMLQMLIYFALSFGELLMITSIGFMIGTIFRSSAMAIGISMFIMFTGSIISFFLLRYDWGKYSIFPNLELTQYRGGAALISNELSLGFSLAVLAVYFVVFNVLSWYIFSKRDVALS